MQRITLLSLGLWLALGWACQSEDFALINPIQQEGQSTTGRTSAEILERLKDADASDVLVVAHRGVTENAPENSLSSVQAAIDLGVDIVELDLELTKDGEVILMHDATLDRTTTGSGNVADFTLAEIQQLFLRNTSGITTNERVPTLSEVMQLAKGKIMVRLDKGYDILDQAMEVLQTTQTVDHALFVVQKEISPGKVSFDWPGLMDSAFFHPTIDADGNSGPISANQYAEYNGVLALETSFTNFENLTIDWKALRQSGFRVMVYTGSAGSSGGFDDQLAKQDTDLSYGWLIDQGVNMIQTKEPRLLLDYLRVKGLHP